MRFGAHGLSNIRQFHFIRATVGPTSGTEILRGADQELLADLNQTWTQQGMTVDALPDVADVANALVSLITSARCTPSVMTEAVRLVSRPQPGTSTG